jgi:hypothetical protein
MSIFHTKEGGAQNEKGPEEKKLKLKLADNIKLNRQVKKKRNLV